MFNNMKTALIPFSIIVLFLANASLAEAQSFEDVAEGTWYYDYVEELAEEGIVDAEGLFRPNDELTRAELAVMVIKAIDGLAGFETPVEPTFSDVPLDSFYYTYVEAAASLGIVGGYTDVDGSLTGVFGPDATITRAAATKVLTSAFDIPSDLQVEPVFPDVVEESWFY